MFHPDTRKDLGIARLAKNPRIHDMVGSNSWPYVDDYEDFEYTEKELKTKEIIDQNTLHPIDDYGDVAGIDRSAFHDIIKVETAAKGISPFPAMYKKRDGHLGRSAKSIQNTHALGFYTDVHASGHNYKHEYPEDDEPAYSLEDIALNQLRECIRYMLKEYYEQV
tara:strand:+ start:2482 stop:2976 length:495 start_codon:yes stop_codon:yes gene_type:complete